MQIIRNWLGGQQNFTVGATLYRSFGANEDFKTLLLQGETTEIQQQLVTALQQLVTPQADAEKLPVPEPETALTGAEVREMAASNNEVLQSIRNEWQPLYQRMNLLRHNLDKYGADNSQKAKNYRQPIAAEIKSLEKQCNAIWAKRAYYEKEGKLPFEPTKEIEIPTDPLKLAQLINNIKKSIRTNRKLTKDYPGKPRYAELYLHYKEKYKLVTGADYNEKELP